MSTTISGLSALSQEAPRFPFSVAGHGGYYHLHGLNADPDGNAVDAETQAHLMAANDLQHGYVTLTVDKQHISGFMTTVTDPRREGSREGRRV